jgi:hypothetical protein
LLRLLHVRLETTGSEPVCRTPTGAGKPPSSPRHLCYLAPFSHPLHRGNRPYDAEARYSIKRGMAWRGYKAHFTETCPDDRPRLIVHVDTTEASLADVETTPAGHTALEAAGLSACF